MDHRDEKSVLKLVGAFASGNLVAMALGLATAVLQSRFVEPDVLGLFKKFSILSTYLVFLGAGTSDLLAREYPFLIGTGETHRAERLARACLAWNVLMSGLCAMLFIGLALASGLGGDLRAAAGWTIQVPVAVAALYGVFLQTTLRTSSDFAKVARSSVLGAVAGAACLVFVWLWPFEGLCIKTVAAATVALALLHVGRPLRASPTFDWGTIGRAIQAGIPLSVVGYVDTALARAAEASIVLAAYGAKALGLFALTQTAFTAYIVIPVAIGVVYLPRFSMAYGKTRRVGHLIKESLRPTSLSFAGMVALAALAWLGAGPAVRLIAPGYAEAIPSIQAIALVGPLWALRLPGLTLYASGKTVAYGFIVFSGFAAFAAAAAVSVSWGLGIEGIVGAIVVGGIIRAMVMAVVLWRVVLAEGDVIDLGR